MQLGVLLGDGQTQTGASGTPLPRRIGAPEPVEHQVRLAVLQPHPVVDDRHRQRLLATAHRDLHRTPLAVVDGIGQQVAQDALHATGVDLLHHRFSGQVELDLAADLLGQRTQLLHRGLHHATHIDHLAGQVGHAGVMPGDLQQVTEEHLEPVQFGIHQLRGASGHRIKVLGVGVDQVGGHTDRGQRGTQLMGDIRGELLLQRAELLELADLV